MRWVVLWGLFGVFVLAGVGQAAGIEWFADGMAGDRYDCQLTLQPSAHLADGSTLTVILQGATGDKTRVSVTRTALAVESVTGSKSRRIGQAVSGVLPDKPYRLTLLRRGDWLGVLAGDSLVFRGQAPCKGESKAGVTAGAGWTVTDARVQALEPVVFADNFMRTADENGGWTIAGGQWNLQSAWDKDPKGGSLKFKNAVFAQNPFAWVGRGNPALCTAGKPFWEDYTCAVSVCPSLDGAAGLAVNLQDATHYLLIRWTPVNDRGPRGNRLQLLKVEGGTETVLATASGGYLPGQWARLAVVSTLAGVHVLVDGHERLAAANVTPWRGGVGLYATGANGAIFDDVAVYGRTVKANLLAEHRQAQVSERIGEDHKGMGEWAAVDSDWNPLPGAPEYKVHRLDFYGDHWMTVPVQFAAGNASAPAVFNGIWSPVAPATSGGTETLAMILNGDGNSNQTGYRALASPSADGKALICTLYHNAEKLTEKSCPALNVGEEYTFRFSHAMGRLRLELDSDLVLEAADGGALPGLRPAYLAKGRFKAGDVLVLGNHLLDYTFADAPTDWLMEGAWMATTRWACSNQWSFLGGWSRGDAVLWHKQRFIGDQFFEAFVAPKMEYPREHETYWTRFRDMAVTICGDGHDPRTGYTGMFGAPDQFGNPNRRTLLMRNGEIVQAINQSAEDGMGEGHTEWFDLMLVKEGNTVAFWVKGRRIITYRDDHPLDGGVPGVWTSDNGLAVARIRLGSANLPVPRTDPLVTIDDPWYPAWANLNRPLTLAFPHAISTSGKPITLQATARNVPADEHAAPVVAGDRITITPQATGDHWYQIRATDGHAASPAFHVTLPVYNPALKRDDSHTLVLYRFDEEKGDTIHDHGVIGPPADLIIPAQAPVEWQPGQGITIHGAGRMMTKRGVEKLMAIAKQKACSIELWMSPDTLYPPTYWLAGLLAWEQPNEKRNFAVSHLWWDILVATHGRTFNPYGGNTLGYSRVIRTGLEHVMVTWDGNVTKCYVNGNYVGENRGAWEEGQWDPTAPLILGSLADGQPNYHDNISYAYQIGTYIMPNRPEMQHCFLGSIYLAAIHDRCFSDEEVKRHFEAGPSAK